MSTHSHYLVYLYTTVKHSWDCHMAKVMEGDVGYIRFLLGFGFYAAVLWVIADAVSKAWEISAMISSICSMPTDNLT